MLIILILIGIGAGVGAITLYALIKNLAFIIVAGIVIVLVKRNKTSIMKWIKENVKKPSK